jgi:hypothetical protein
MWETDAAGIGGTGRRVDLLMSQNATATIRPSPPMIGRNTRGGLVMTLNPLMAATGDALGVGLGLSLGDAEGDSVGDGDSDGDADGEGEGDPDSEKVAHGLGATLAQSLCWPGVSPANGLTCVVKFPPESAVAEPATLL